MEVRKAGERESEGGGMGGLMEGGGVLPGEESAPGYDSLYMGKLSEVLRTGSWI